MLTRSDLRPEVSYTPGQRVEVLLCGWGWWPGTVNQVGRLQGMECVGVLLDEAVCGSIYRPDQVRLLDKTLQGPIGGLFLEME